MKKPIRLFLAPALIGACAVSAGIDAGPLDKFKQKLSKKTEAKVDKAMDTAIDCAFGDTECIAKAEADGKSVNVVDQNGKPMTDAEVKSAQANAQAGAPADAPGTGVWRGYDYTPGAEVWRHVVFDDERIGRFPAGQLEFVEGNMQIVELDGRKVLEVSAASVFRLNLDRELPQGFTVEFGLKIGAANQAVTVYFGELDTSVSRYESHYLNIYRTAGIASSGQFVSSIEGRDELMKGIVPIRLQVDGEYAILYVGSERAANIPNAAFKRTKMLEFHFTANQNYRSYLDSITVAVGLDPLYETLRETGSFTTRGIYFDSDSDRLQPESTPTLLQLENALTRHADLRIRIEGHTDSSGDDAHNLDLSERRAKAVVNYLTGRGIDASRLESKGLGESAPVADNESAAGRAQNRRVVIVLRED